MTKRKICFVVSRPGTAISFLAGAMSKLKDEYTIHLVANFANGESVDRLPLTEVKDIGIELKPSPLKDLKALWQLYRYFKANDFYAVHSYTLKASLLTALAGSMARVPHRLRNFSGQLWCNMTGWKRRFFKMIEHIIVTLDNGFIVDCNAQRQYLINEGILSSPDQAKIMYRGSVCGLDSDKFTFDPEQRIAVRNELGIADDTVVFIFLGRLRREKGIFELLGAFDRMATKYSNILLLLVGGDEGQCIEHIGDYPHLKQGENVIYYGFTPRPVYLLHAGDIYALPSHREGFGMAALEASSIGLPVICSDTYGMTDTMVDNVTGLRCKTGDTDSLFDCMERLILDKALRRKLGENGAAWVRDNFPQDKVSDAWLDFYRNLRD